MDGPGTSARRLERTAARLRFIWGFDYNSTNYNFTTTFDFQNEYRISPLWQYLLLKQIKGLSMMTHLPMSGLVWNGMERNGTEWYGMVCMHACVYMYYMISCFTCLDNYKQRLGSSLVPPSKPPALRHVCYFLSKPSCRFSAIGLYYIMYYSIRYYSIMYYIIIV